MLPDSVSELPVAVHVLAEVQEIAVKPLPVDAAALELSWLVQVRPSQLSTRGTLVPVLLSYAPAAVQETGPVHETPSSVAGPG